MADSIPVRNALKNALQKLVTGISRKVARDQLDGGLYWWLIRLYLACGGDVSHIRQDITSSSFKAMIAQAYKQGLSHIRKTK